MFHQLCIYWLLCHLSLSDLDSEHTLRTILKLFIQVTLPWLVAPEGINRTVAQVVLADLLEKYPEFTQDDTIRRVFRMLEENKRILAMAAKTEDDPYSDQSSS